MADIFIAEQSAPSTPASGNLIAFADSTASAPAFKTDAGRAGLMVGGSFNASIAAQGAGFATDTYLTDSDLLIPSFGVQARTVFRWKIVATKTAAGVATPVYSIRIGSARTTADTARVQITGYAQTAAADAAVIWVVATVRTVGAAGVIYGSCFMAHDLAATGFATTAAGISLAAGAGFDNSALGGLYVGLSINAGASAAWTVQQVDAVASW